MVAHLPDDGLLTAVVRLTSSQVYHVEVSMLSATRVPYHVQAASWTFLPAAVPG